MINSCAHGHLLHHGHLHLQIHPILFYCWRTGLVHLNVQQWAQVRMPFALKDQICWCWWMQAQARAAHAVGPQTLGEAAAAAAAAALGGLIMKLSTTFSCLRCKQARCAHSARSAMDLIPAANPTRPS